MAPIRVGIGGDRSGSGKTLVASRLLRRFKGWGAIKCSPSELYSAVIDDPDTLREPGKDTARYLEAGASGVVLVRAPRNDLEESLAIAMGKLSHLEGVIIEGNSAVETLRETSDVIIFIVSGEGVDLKDNTGGLLKKADVVLYCGEPPAGVPSRARLIRMDNEDEFMECLRGLINGRKG